MNQTMSTEQCLKELGYAIVPVKGTSMLPLLPEGRCRVHLEAREGGQCKVGDIVLFQRSDGTLVLHRIIQIAEQDSFLVCGDHQWKQVEQVSKDQILAAAQGFYRDGHYMDDDTWWYRIYKAVWNGSLTVRRCCLAFLRISGLEKKSLK